LKLGFAVSAFALFISASAFGQVKMDGQFVATKACPAVVSLKKGTNPDNVAIEVGKGYDLLGKNKPDATAYWIKIPSANPAQRWVTIDCGTTNGTAATPIPAPAQKQASTNTPLGTVKPKAPSRGFGGKEPYYAFAMSWEPTFCESMRDKAECKAETKQSFEATHFTIHGLWPQPRRNQFCNVAREISALDDQHQWNQLPEPELSAQTRSALAIAMPGTMSNLQRHEWIKHGTCYPASNAEQYFKDELRLAAEINASTVQKFVASNIGKNISANDLRAKFDESFGAGTGAHVQMECDKQGRFGGFTMNLRGDIPGGANLATLLAAGNEAQNKCDSGVVDEVN
jgi:ribonuclease T2